MRHCEVCLGGQVKLHHLIPHYTVFTIAGMYDDCDDKEDVLEWLMSEVRRKKELDRAGEPAIIRPVIPGKTPVFK